MLLTFPSDDGNNGWTSESAKQNKKKPPSFNLNFIPIYVFHENAKL